MLAAIHGLLRGEGERLRPRCADLGLDRKRHAAPLSRQRRTLLAPAGQLSISPRCEARKGGGAMSPPVATLSDRHGRWGRNRVVTRARVTNTLINRLRNPLASIECRAGPWQGQCGTLMSTAQACWRQSAPWLDRCPN